MKTRTLFVAALLFSVRLLSAQESESYLKGQFRAQEAARFQKLVQLSSVMTPGQEGFDVTYYKLDLTLTVSPNYLRGSVRMVAKALQDNLTSVTLDLMNAMTVDSVIVGTTKTKPPQQPSTVLITLDRPYAKNEYFSVVVFYRGVPGSSGFGSFVFSSNGSSPWVWSLSEPYGAKDWWPCKDHPGDKADSVDIWVTCDSRFKVGSEGRLVAVVDNGNGTRTHKWQHRYPIASYLVSIAVAEYSEASGWFKYGSTDSMLVLNYAIPTSAQQATNALPQIINNLRIYSDLFGRYPFYSEKYGHAQFGWGGGMEHQTMTSLINFGESLVAHEMAHQWFGDMITCATWPNIWLNEGFAEYCEALYYEKKSGPSGYRSQINSEFGGARNAVGSIYVRDTASIGSLFNSSLVYSKGAVALHMLRHVVGDSAFFQTMRQYANDSRFRFGTATTDGFRSVCEVVSGKDLGYFFNEWIYGENCPTYSFEWGYVRTDPTYTARVNLKQTTGTTNPAFFKMPVDLRFTGVGLDTTLSVMNDVQNQTFLFTLAREPSALQFDPGNWILQKSQATGKLVAFHHVGGDPQEYALGQNYPNPFRLSTVIPVDLGSPSTIRIEVYNVLGERIGVLINDQPFESGSYLVQLDKSLIGGSSLPSGVYYYRLKVSGTVIQTRKMVYLR